MPTHVFTGDSITDCGRRDDPDVLGLGCVRLIVQKTGDHPLNSGVGGHRALCLEARWDADVPTMTADTLTNFVGTNTSVLTPAAD